MSHLNIDWPFLHELLADFFFLQQLCLNAINSPQSVCSIKNWQMFPKCLLGIFLSVYICSKDISVFSHASRGRGKFLSPSPLLQFFFPSHIWHLKISSIPYSFIHISKGLKWTKPVHLIHITQRSLRLQFEQEISVIHHKILKPFSETPLELFCHDKLAQLQK